MKERAGRGTEDRHAAALIGRMARGDAQALDALFQLYHRPLLSLCRAILSDSFEADETLQDTFVRAWQQAGRYDPQAGTPFAWLATICRRLAIDKLRRRRARPDFPANPLEHPENSMDNDSRNAETDARRELEFRWVQESLRELPEAQRRALELAFLQGYTQHEIAEKLDRPLGTVKSDLHRGLMQLRKLFMRSDD